MNELSTTGSMNNEALPFAAICKAGHTWSWSVTDMPVPAFCGLCGEPMMTACLECNRPMTGSARMPEDAPYFPHCLNCGKAFPWRRDAISRAKQTMLEAADTSEWSEESKERAIRLADDLAADRVSASGVETATAWIESRNSRYSRPVIVELVLAIGSKTLVKSLNERRWFDEAS